MAGNMNQSKAQPAPGSAQLMTSYIGSTRNKNSESSVSPLAIRLFPFY